MVTIKDWIEYINSNVSNMSAHFNGNIIEVNTYGSHTVDIAFYFESAGAYPFEELAEYDIDLLTLELDDGSQGTLITGADPFGLIAYIKAAY